MLLTSKPFSLPGTSRGGSHHRPGAQLLKCPATPRLHEHHDKGEKDEHEHTVPAANGGQTRGSVAPVPPPAVRAEASTSSPSHVRALISHWEAVTQGEASATAVSELVNAELEQTPKEGKAQPSLRALAMAASMGDAKRQSSKSSSRTSGAVNRGSNTSMSAVPEASTEGDVPVSPQDSLRYSRPVTALGKRQLLNHLQVLDSLNYAYSARSAELRAKKPRAPTTPEGIRAADWVLQVLGYKMDDQALEGWETRVLEGAARAGVPLEEVLGPEAVNRYKARVPLEEVLGPGAVDGNKVALLERMPPTPRQPSLQRPSSPPSQPDAQGSQGTLAAPSISPTDETAPTSNAEPSTVHTAAPNTDIFPLDAVAPPDVAVAPVDEAVAPVDNAAAPVDNDVAPVDDVMTPTNGAVSPADAAIPSIHSVAAPHDAAVPPGHDSPPVDAAAPLVDARPTLPDLPPTAPLPQTPPSFPPTAPLPRTPPSLPSTAPPVTFLPTAPPQTFPPTAPPQTFPPTAPPQTSPPTAPPQTFPPTIPLARTLPTSPATAPLSQTPPGTGRYLVTPYGDVVPEESGLLLQQLTLGALAVASSATAPLGTAANGMDFIAKGVGRVVDVCSVLGKLCVTAVYVAQSKLPLLPPSKYTPGPQDPTPRLPPSLDPGLASDTLRQLLGGQPIGHFKKPMGSSKYAPKLPDMADSEATATPEWDALRLLLSGQPIGHFKQPPATNSKYSKYAPRLFDEAQAPPSLAPGLSSDFVRQLLGGQPIGHFKLPTAVSKYAPRLPTQWGVEEGEEDLALPTQQGVEEKDEGLTLPTQSGVEQEGEGLALPTQFGVEQGGGVRTLSMQLGAEHEGVGLRLPTRRDVEQQEEEVLILPTLRGVEQQEEGVLTLPMQSGVEQDEEDFTLPMPPPQLPSDPPASHPIDIQEALERTDSFESRQTDAIQPAAAAPDPPNLAKGALDWFRQAGAAQPAAAAPVPPNIALTRQTDAAQLVAAAVDPVPPHVKEARDWIAKHFTWQSGASTRAAFRRASADPLPALAAPYIAAGLASGAIAEEAEIDGGSASPMSAAARFAAHLAAAAAEGSAAAAKQAIDAACKGDTAAVMVSASDAATLASAAAGDAANAAAAVQKRGGAGSKAATIAQAYAVAAKVSAERAAAVAQQYQQRQQQQQQQQQAPTAPAAMPAVAAAQQQQEQQEATAAGAVALAAAPAASAAAPAVAAAQQQQAPVAPAAAPAAALPAALAAASEPAAAPAATPAAAPAAVSEPAAAPAATPAAPPAAPPPAVVASVLPPPHPRKKMYKGDPIRQILAGTAPSLPALPSMPAISRKYAPSLPTSWGHAANAAKQPTTTPSSQQLLRSAPATAAEPTAHAATSSSSNKKDEHGTSIWYKFAPRAPTQWGQAASHMQTQRAGQHTSGKSPVRLLLDWLSGWGARKEAKPAKATGPASIEAQQAGRSDVAPPAANSSSASDHSSSSNGSTLSGASSLSRPTDSLTSLADSLAGQPAADQPAGMAAPGSNNSSSSSSWKRMQAVRVPRPMTVAAPYASAVPVEVSSRTGTTQQEPFQVRVTDHRVERVGLQADPLSFVSEDMGEACVASAMKAFEMLASKEMAQLRTKHEPIFVLLAAALHSSNVTRRAIWNTLTFGMAKARLGPACKQVPYFLKDLQAFQDLRPLHRVLVPYCEDEEKVIAILASLTAKYMAKHDSMPSA